MRNMRYNEIRQALNRSVYYLCLCSNGNWSILFVLVHVSILFFTIHVSHHVFPQSTVWRTVNGFRYWHSFIPRGWTVQHLVSWRPPPFLFPKIKPLICFPLPPTVRMSQRTPAVSTLKCELSSSDVRFQFPLWSSGHDNNDKLNKWWRQRLHFTTKDTANIIKPVNTKKPLIMSISGKLIQTINVTLLLILHS